MYGSNDESPLGMGCLEFSAPGDFNVGQELLGYFIVSKLAQPLPLHTLFMAGAFIGFINHTTSYNCNHQFA